MARQYGYLFPIYYQVSSLRAEGAGTNYAIGGLFAWGGVLAHRLTGGGRYRGEARRALGVVYTLPADRLVRQDPERSYRGPAAAELGVREQEADLVFEQ